ncbi:MAG: hypothetical protein KGJ38_02590 [Burkholderiaceae bacterium]|nr:hypothetical protein [Burkholderiaceae bacterium]
MKRFQPSLHEEVFRIFARACREAEFGVADHLLGAIEFIAQQEGHPEQSDFAYLLVADSCVYASKQLPGYAAGHSRPKRPTKRLGTCSVPTATGEKLPHHQRRRTRCGAC